MNKKYFFVILFLTIIGFIILFFIKNDSNKNSSSYNSARTVQNVTNDNTNVQNETKKNTIPVEISETDENTKKEEKHEPEKSTEIASFTTKIYNKDKDRQNNINLACSSLNNTLVENGKTFSFSSTVGKATSGKGYKKADVFKNGDVIEALGGGLCQVSTTLYNAILKVPDTKVTERHSHSNKVPYIKPGKDAAVSYGTYDFKFVNNTRKYFKNNC